MTKKTTGIPRETGAPVNSLTLRDIVDLPRGSAQDSRIQRSNRNGETEFESVRVVDSGALLADILPATVDEYAVNLYSLDASMKYRGWSATFEYYFRQINQIQGAALPDLFDHGHWLQIGKFVVHNRVQLLARWSRVGEIQERLALSTKPPKSCQLD